MKKLINKLLRGNPLWIVDVGASGGVDLRWKKFAPSCKFVLFEPNADDCAVLQANNPEGHVILNTALSESARTVDLHLCRKAQVSSIYQPNIHFLKKFHAIERFTVEKTVRLRADTLDHQLGQSGRRDVDFIKIDTQGYELPILKGSVNSLQHVIGLEIEVEFAPLYKDQPLFCDVDSFAKGAGFELFDLKKVFWKRKEYQRRDHRKGQLVWADALYLKSPEQVLLMTDMTSQKVVRAFCIYLAYGYLDLAHVLLQQSFSRGLLTKETYEGAKVLLDRKQSAVGFPWHDNLSGWFCWLVNVFGSKGPFSGRDRTLGN